MLWLVGAHALIRIPLCLKTISRWEATVGSRSCLAQTNQVPHDHELSENENCDAKMSILTRRESSWLYCAALIMKCKWDTGRFLLLRERLWGRKIHFWFVVLFLESDHIETCSQKFPPARQSPTQHLLPPRWPFIGLWMYCGLISHKPMIEQVTERCNL